jgi:tRNA G37 N-methylase TrmD
MNLNPKQTPGGNPVSDTAKRVGDLLVERNKIIGRMQYCVLRGDIAALNLVDANIARCMPGLLEEYDAALRERDELKAEVARRVEQDRANITLTEVRDRAPGVEPR